MLGALALLACFTPTLAFGQNAKAGVVTTLEGNVVAVRGGLAQPVPLKFRDDVFLDDRITTGDRSLARLLLGGKAVVTVRERSSLTVTEVPGRATINLESGKIAVAVARQRMRPGDTLEVRTPNAVAGVRGTVFIVDVSQPTAQGTPPATGAVTTQISTLQGSVGVQFVGPAGASVGSIIVGANQFAAQTGTTGTPRSGTLTPQQRAAALAGLQATIRATGAANSDQVKEQLTQTTAAVLGTLLGDSSSVPWGDVTAPRSLSEGNTNTLASGEAVINACTTDRTVCQAALSRTGTGIPVKSLLVNDLLDNLVPYDTPRRGPLLAASADLTLMAPLLVSTNIAGRNLITSTTDLIGVTGGATLIATLASSATALVQSDHTDYDVGYGGIALRHFFRAEGTGGVGGIVPSSAVLTGTLLASTQDTLDVTAAMLAVNSGSQASIVSFTSTTTSPLMSFDGSRVTLGSSACGGHANCIASATGTGNFIEVTPFTTITLNGPIATVTAPREGWVMDTLVSSFGSGGLTTSGHTGPLFSFDGATGTPHRVNGAMFDLGGSTTTLTDLDLNAPVTVRLGIDQPLRHSGTLYQGSGGATLTTTNVVKLDTALMAAMAPIVSLAGAGTALTSAGDAFALTQRAKLTADIPADALVKVNGGASFTVTNGSLVNVAAGSFASLNVAALVSLTGGSTMSFLNGLLATVSGNGSFALTGALVGFSGSNNTLVVNNAYVPTGFINGVPVYSALGGTTGFNITRTNGNLFPGLGSNNNVIKINDVVLPLNATTATGSLLAITGGATSKIKVE